MKPLILGTRGSALARWQAEHVAASLREAHPGLELEIQIIKTTGDVDQRSSIEDVGGRGVFVREIEQALLEGRIDLAVHSLKDLPTTQPDGLCLGAIPERHDARDLLISPAGAHLEGLPEGARVATGSLRRRCQLLHIRPDLDVVPVRGNVDTRLRKLWEGQFDALMLALAGIERLELQFDGGVPLDVERFIPAVGQGALGIEIRDDDRETARRVAALGHADSTWRVTAERAYLRRLEGGCLAPAAAHGVMLGGVLQLTGVVGDADGGKLLRETMQGAPEEAEALGVRLADAMLARGAGELLQSARRGSGSEGGRELAGKKLLLTRPVGRGGDTRARLEEFGAEVLSIPTIALAPPEDISPLRAAVRDIGSYAWVVFTSPGGVHFFFERLHAENREIPRPVRLAAVGPGTARQIVAVGAHVSLIADDARAEGLLADLQARIEPSDRVLIVRPEVGGDVLEGGLCGVAGQVDSVACYRTVAAPQAAAAAGELMAGGVDGVLFASPSSLHGLLGATDGPEQAQGLREALEATARVAIGPVTAAAMLEAGFPARETATAPTAGAVAEAFRKALA